MLRMRKKPPVEVKDKDVFFRVVRAAFGMRRKTLLNALSAYFGELGKEDIEKIIVSCGFDPRIRGEVLDIGEFAQISDEIFNKLSANSWVKCIEIVPE